jgi:hypothetical protein
MLPGSVHGLLQMRLSAACRRAATTGSVDVTDEHPVPSDEVPDVPM